jgi:hypothetical protein
MSKLSNPSNDRGSKKDTDNGRVIELEYDILHLVVGSTGPT